MVLQVGLQPVPVDFGCVLGGQATKSTVLVRLIDLFCVSFELGGQISLDQWSTDWPSASTGWFWLCFGWPGHKIYCPGVAKRTFFVLIFGQEWHLPPQHPGFGSKHSSKVNQGPVHF